MKYGIDLSTRVNVRSITQITQRELELGVADPGKSSWHDDYKGSAYVFVGGLSFDLTEGDVLSVMSQYGEIVNINLVRDKKTGKSKGFCFIGYEDQRSTTLAVDNLNGIKLCGRTIRVDHVKEYRRPKDEQGNEIIETGCAPKTPTPSPEPAEPVVKEKKKKNKKEKKKKEKKKDKKKEKSVLKEGYSVLKEETSDKQRWERRDDDSSRKQFEVDPTSSTSSDEDGFKDNGSISVRKRSSEGLQKHAIKRTRNDSTSSTSSNNNGGQFRQRKGMERHRQRHSISPPLVRGSSDGKRRRTNSTSDNDRDDDRGMSRNDKRTIDASFSQTRNNDNRKHGDRRRQRDHDGEQDDGPHPSHHLTDRNKERVTQPRVEGRTDHNEGSRRTRDRGGEERMDERRRSLSTERRRVRQHEPRQDGRRHARKRSSSSSGVSSDNMRTEYIKRRHYRSRSPQRRRR